MDHFFQTFQLLLNSDQIIRVGGLALVTAIVFAETGLFFCFFLPGDYLLFSAGILCASGSLPVRIQMLFGCILGAAILGNMTGYLFGRFLGYKLETMRESFFYKREYVTNTQKAFDKYGGKALIIGRFLPIIRTFAPILAGATKLPWGSFILYNILGGLMWVSALVLGGYFLGQQFPGLANYLEYIIVAFIAFTSIVVVRSWLAVRRQQRLEQEAALAEHLRETAPEPSQV